MQQAAPGGIASVVTPSDAGAGAAGSGEGQATAESAGAAERRSCQGPSTNLRPRRQPAAAAAAAIDSPADDSDWHSGSEGDDEADGSEHSAASEEDAAADAGECGSDDVDWEQQQPAAAAAGPVDDSTTQAAPGSRKRGRQQQSGSNVRRVARRRSAATADAADMPAGAARGRRQSRGCQKVVIEELPGGIIQSSADVLVKTKGDIRLPKGFVKRCFPRLPCELPLRLEMAPAAAGAGVASQRPAGALADTTIKLRPYTYSYGQSCVILSSTAAAGLGSYRGFKIIAWQAPTPDSSGSNSSRLTMVMQPPAAQQAVAAAAAAEQAAAAAAAKDAAAAAAGGDGSGHTHAPSGVSIVQHRQMTCPRKLVAGAFLPHHPAGTRSLQVQLSVLKDGQPVVAAAVGSGGGWSVSLTFNGSSWQFALPAAVLRLVSGCKLQLMRATAGNLLQVFVLSNSSTHQPAGSEAAVAAAGANPSAARSLRRGRTPGSPGKAASIEHNTTPAAAAAFLNTGRQQHQQQQQGEQQQGKQQQAMHPAPAAAAPASRQRAGNRDTAAGTEQHASRSHQRQQQQRQLRVSAGPSSLTTAGRSRSVVPVKAEPAAQLPAATPDPAASNTAADHTGDRVAAEPAAAAAAVVAHNLTQLPAGYELPPVDSAAAGMQQLLGLLQLLQADQSLLAKFTAKLGRLQQAPVGDRQLHWFAVSYEMVRTWLQQGRLDMVLQSLDVALA